MESAAHCAAARAAAMNETESVSEVGASFGVGGGESSKGEGSNMVRSRRTAVSVDVGIARRVGRWRKPKREGEKEK